MPTPEEIEDYRLDSSAAALVTDLTTEFRECFLTRAAQNARGTSVTTADIEKAHKQWAFPTPESLELADAQTIISRALSENRAVEWVSYGMAVVFFFVGLYLLLKGAATADLAARVGHLAGGSIVELMILVPFRFAIHSRRHNIALRMLGMIIDRVDDPKKLAALLKETYLTVVLGNIPRRD
jgi:hypothetical protein